MAIRKTPAVTSSITIRARMGVDVTARTRATMSGKSAAAKPATASPLASLPGLSRDLRRRYDQQMRAWFGELRPLRLEGAGRFFNPPPALPMRTIFVPPALSATAVAPDAAEPTNADAADILKWLDQHPRLVVLGDPGSGKSTLVAWLTWRLCAGLTEPLPAWCDGVLPVPLLLRDLPLRAPLDFDDLLKAWLGSALLTSPNMLQHDLGEALQSFMADDGEQLLFLVDGLDELASHLRIPVRDALRDAMRRWPQARFVITSRSVGYDDCPVDVPARAVELHLRAFEAAERAERAPKVQGREALVRDTAERALAAAALDGFESTGDVRRLHVLPFDNARIRRFAAQWFAHGDSIQQRADDLQRQFVDGLLRDDAALQITRTPNLLVMAAQVFGISNTLPDGRARLYEAITKAYLESIEQRYGLADTRYSFEQKKSWLAALGWQMQLRRGAPGAAYVADDPGAVARNAGDGRNLLVAESDVVAWLQEAMRESGVEADESFVRGFVDAIARRSGLFIPRGDELYAFSHLSIQEYFAALHLQAGMRELPAINPPAYQALLRLLGQLGKQRSWRETLVTFFELPDWSPRMLPVLCDAVFGSGLANVPAAPRLSKSDSDVNAAPVELLARLVAHPGVALSPTWRYAARDRVFAFLKAERGQSANMNSEVLTALTTSESGCRLLWDSLKRQPDALGDSPTTMDLSRAKIRDWEPLRDFMGLTSLQLNGTGFSDLALLKSMSDLDSLFLLDSPVQTLQPLSELRKLRSLAVGVSPPMDLSPVATLLKLEQLLLFGLGDADIRPLGQLRNLKQLLLTGFEAIDLTCIADLPNLKVLIVFGGKAPLDLAPLARLPVLTSLYLGGSPAIHREAIANKPGLMIYD